MKMKTEAARLFIAIMALILVGMLSGSLGNFNEEPVRAAQLHNPQKPTDKARKVAQKALTKKSSRLTDF